MTRTLPPGLSEEQFDTALARFREVVGDKWVLSSTEELEKLQGPLSGGRQRGLRPLSGGLT